MALKRKIMLLWLRISPLLLSYSIEVSGAIFEGNSRALRSFSFSWLPRERDIYEQISARGSLLCLLNVSLQLHKDGPSDGLPVKTNDMKMSVIGPSVNENNDYTTATYIVCAP